MLRKGHSNVYFASIGRRAYNENDLADGTIHACLDEITEAVNPDLQGLNSGRVSIGEAPSKYMCISNIER